MAPGPQGSKFVCSQAPSDPTCLACRQQSDCASTRLTPSDPPLPTVTAHDTIHTHHISHITHITQHSPSSCCSFQPSHPCVRQPSPRPRPLVHHTLKFACHAHAPLVYHSTSTRCCKYGTRTGEPSPNPVQTMYAVHKWPLRRLICSGPPSCLCTLAKLNLSDSSRS